MDICSLQSGVLTNANTQQEGKVRQSLFTMLFKVSGLQTVTPLQDDISLGKCKSTPLCKNAESKYEFRWVPTSSFGHPLL
jgi:hypothetical protein